MQNNYSNIKDFKFFNTEFAILLKSKNTFHILVFFITTWIFWKFKYKNITYTMYL